MKRKILDPSLRGALATWQSIKRFPRGLRSLGMTFVFVLIFLANPASALAATLSLDPANGTFNQGCGFSLNINLDTGVAQTDGTDAILLFDSSRFTATSITNGTIYPDYPGNNIDAAAGKITISGLASVSTPFTGKGILATVNFTVSSGAAAGSTQVTFDFDPYKAKTTDSNVVERGTIIDILNSVVNGNYVVGTAPCSAQVPSSIPSSMGGAAAGGTTTPGQRTGGAGGLSSSGFVSGTPSAANIPGQTRTTLPQGGTQEFTAAIAIVGSILSILGILGLALL